PCFDLTQTARLVIQPFLALHDEERLEDLRVVVLPEHVLTGLEVVNGLFGVARVDGQSLTKDRYVGVVVVAEPLVQALVELNGVMLAGPLLGVASVALLLDFNEESPTGGFGDDGCLWSNPGTWTKEVAKFSGLVDNLVAIGVENLCGGRDEE